MLKIKNWKKFQHFKNRRPPWIKLYRDLLDDVEWFNLPPESFKFLAALWLMASESSDGYLPDIKAISFRYRIDIKETNRLLSTLSHWIEGDDISLISPRYQVGSPETETERETEAEKEREKDRAPARVSPPRKVFQKPTVDEVAEYAKSIEFDLSAQKFCDYYESKGWVVGKSPMKDWKACVRTWKQNNFGSNGNTGGFQNGTKRDDGFATAKPGKYPD